MRNEKGQFTNDNRLDKRKFSDEQLLHYWHHRQNDVKTISSKLNVSRSTVLRRLNKIGIYPKPFRFTKNHTKRITHGKYRLISEYKKTHPKCELCGWDLSVDIHHIVPLSKGGTNDWDNLIALCPNHHRMVHLNMISDHELRKAKNKLEM